MIHLILFCGFYVAGADTQLYNEATQVALMRHGTKTVLSMQNHYDGPPEDFAMVVPVPVVLQQENVKTLPHDLFRKLDRLSAPRLVEYWEQDPCSGTMGSGAGTGSGYGVGSGRGGMRGRESSALVRIEAQFAVGEYQIVILSADEAAALEAWLRGNGYKIPAGAEPYLKPYVEAGMKFFVAKVDVEKVQRQDGRAVLSPLRIAYDSETFGLPIRLGLINSKGVQDLIVYLIADRRYEVANRPNVTIPTNLLVTADARERFGEMYAALFDATLEKNPGAVVTEYAWGAQGCDPCPSGIAGGLNPFDLATLGGDLIPMAVQVRGGASVTFGNLEVTGPMEGGIVRRYLRRALPRLAACQTLPRPAGGTVSLEFQIDEKGRADQVKATGIPGVEGCVADAVKAIEFPKPQGGRVSVKLPLAYPAGGGAGGGVTAPGAPMSPIVLTRLHLRYRKQDRADDLVFRQATPITGGTGVPDAEGKLERAPASQRLDNFQGRYVILHRWEGKVECAEPRRGVWGRPPLLGGATGEVKPASDLAFVKRGGVTLASMIVGGMPSLPAAVDAGVPPAPAPPAASPPPPGAAEGKGCGCVVGGRRSGTGLLWIVLGVAAIWGGRWVLVTGASSGIGEAFARALAARRANLILTARRETLLLNLADALAHDHGVETRVIAGDLAEPGGAARLAGEVAALGLEVEHLINNAGFGVVGRLSGNDEERLAAMVRVNCEALTVLSRRFLAPMVERGCGGILHVASVAGLQPVPFMAAYGATKAYVVSLSLALSEEVRGSGVRVMALCPGPVPTGFQAAAGIKRPSAMRAAALSAEQTVSRALAAYEDGRDLCVPGAMNRLSSLGARLLPRSLVLRAAASMMRRSGRT